MTEPCCSTPDTAPPSHQYRAILWVALLINGVMFAVELAGGLASGSTSLLADAVDFFSDAANYAITLVVLPLAFVRRTQAAIFKGVCMGMLGAFVVGRALWGTVGGTAPEPGTMGAIAVLALVANVFVAVLLYTWRDGDANMRSVWLCSRNDAIGNLAVIVAAIGVAGTSSRWPDLLVAMMLGVLNVHAAWTVLVQARAELAKDRTEVASEVPGAHQRVSR